MIKISDQIRISYIVYLKNIKREREKKNYFILCTVVIVFILLIKYKRSNNHFSLYVLNNFHSIIINRKFLINISFLIIHYGFFNRNLLNNN